MAIRLRTDGVAAHLRHIEDIKWPSINATGRQLLIGGEAALALIQYGYLSAKEETQDSATLIVTVIDPATITAFSATYVSLHALAHEINGRFEGARDFALQRDKSHRRHNGHTVLDFSPVRVPRP